MSIPLDRARDGRQTARLDRLIRAALLSGPSMWLKRTARNLVWRRRARRFDNPPWPPEVRSILFLCYGNICRSPFAAMLAEKLLHEAGIADVRCTSAGFRTSQGACSPPDAVEAAASYGIRLEGCRPMALTPELVAGSDVVFVMEPSQLESLRQRWPMGHGRFFLLPLAAPAIAPLGAYDRCHIVDPFGKGTAEFDRCYARIAGILRHIVTEWSPRAVPGSAASSQAFHEPR